MSLTQIFRPVEWPARAWVPWLLGVLALVQGLVCWFLPARGDEVLYYNASLAYSTQVWPALNLVKVHYGVSPLFLWVVGGLGHLPGGYLFWGRLLSLAALSACTFSCVRSRSYAALAVFLCPLLLLYSARAHYYLPALACFWFSWRWAKRHPVLGSALMFAAANLAPYLAVHALLFARHGHTLRDRLLRIAVAGAWAAGGVGLSALIYKNFMQKAIVATGSSIMLTRAYVPTYAYFLLIPLLSGAYLWLLGKHPVRPRTAPWGAAIAVTAAAGVKLTTECWGPLFSIGARFGPLETPATIGLLAALGFGWMRLHRDGLFLCVGVAAAGASLFTLPFLLERLGWFAVLPALVTWADLETDSDQPSEITLALVLAGCVLGYVLYHHFTKL